MSVCFSEEVMRIGLASYRFKNKNIDFNLSQIKRALVETEGKVELLCFGEAFLQGFDSLCWNYDIDKEIAVEQDSKLIDLLRNLTVKYKTAILTGYIEKEKDMLFSSCIVISDGKIICNYRRISKGWKNYWETDEHYREGNEIKRVKLNGRDMVIALCGDLWEYPDRFKTKDLIIWPVYVDYSEDEWLQNGLNEYAKQAALSAKNTLMINPIDLNELNHGGSCYFKSGKLIEKTEYDKEQILILDI